MSRLFKVNLARTHFVEIYKNAIPFTELILMVVLFGINSQGWSTTLNLPSGVGGTPNATSWGTNGDVGTTEGKAIATTEGELTAATFSISGSQYVLQSPGAYFDLRSLLDNGSFTIGATSEVINIGGMTFTVKTESEQTVTFGAALTNPSLPGGGLTVSGGGSVAFDNTNSQYTTGMDIGALTVDESTVITLPPSVAFGVGNNGGSPAINYYASGQSYSSIALNTASTLILANGSAIGSQSGGVSVPFSFDTSSPTIQLANSATASITPKFTSAGNTVNIDTNGGTLNIYGNASGTGVTLNVNDTIGTGTLNLYGNQSGSVGGNDYDSTNVNIASGTLNLYLDTGDQSLGSMTMTGGTVTGSANLGGDVTMSGTSKMVATNIQMSNLNMSGTSKVSGTIQTNGDLNLSDNAVFAPQIRTTIIGGNMTANTGAPHYVVSFDGTNVSQISTGTANIPNLQVDLLLAAGTYSSGYTYTKTILTSGDLTAPTAEPTWNITGVTKVDTGAPATGDELTLELTKDGGDLNLTITVNETINVATTTTYNFVAPSSVPSAPSTTSAPSTLVDTASLINATFSNSSSSSDAVMQGSADNFHFTNTSTNPLLPRSMQPNNNASLLESIIRATETSGPVSFSRNETRIWASPYTSRARVNNSLAGIGQQGWSGGSLIGFEKRDRKNIWTVGMLTGLTLSKFHNNGDPDTHSKANGYVMGVYNTLKYTDNKNAGNFGHEVLISRITNVNTMQRRGEQRNVTYFAKAANKSVTNLSNAQLNYIFNLQKTLTCRFSLGGTYTDENEGAYTETNAGTYGNRVGGKNTKAGEIYFGPGLRHIWKDGSHTYRLTGVYEYGVSVYNKGTQQITTTLAATPQVLTNAPSVGENKHYLQVNGSYLNKETGVKFSGSYSGTFYNATENHTFTLKAELRY
ncbi:MAG: autotransporter outer membrane beta-barrel domain-containing protein [Alphaproteobacteria bacterium]|nr:autotransporter outer membrane beta-barrel domain-containing protein [Alphaproteobacteria bacterium]